MAENEDGQEKTEEPTARKLEQARERGELPRSPDFGGAFVVVGLCVLMLLLRILLLLHASDYSAHDDAH